MTVGLTRRPSAPRRPAVPADRLRRARQVAYLGCAGAFGYGGLKVIWALGGTVGLRYPGRFRLSPAGLTAAQRFFDYWGTPILAGLAVVILLGLVYPWGNVIVVRPLLRILAWAGSLLTVVGVAGFTLTIWQFADNLTHDRLGGIHPATYLFVYVCFLVLGLAFGVTAWLTRR